MSTIKITFRLQLLDFSPLTRGDVQIVFFNNGTDTVLKETLTTGSAFSGYFKETFNPDWLHGSNPIPGEPLLDVRNEEQAHNFAVAFSRDYRNVGGTNNLSATVIDNEVTITAKKGTFKDTSSYTGNVLRVSGFVIENTVNFPPIDFDLVMSDNGDCDTITYRAIATNATAPYELSNGNQVLISGWDGSLYSFTLDRGSLNTINISDLNNLAESVTANVPRKLKIGEFKEVYTQFEGYSDVIINSVNPVANTGPLEYALTNVGVASSGYQLSNSFAGVLVGRYELWVRDKYGCEISKVIEVREFEDNLIGEVEKFFLIPEANSLMFAEHRSQEKPNYFNTRTCDEQSVGVRHRVRQSFLGHHIIPTRFLSSYPFHVVTIRKSDGTKINTSIATVQTNLGAKEKVDCKLFNINGSVGVYFQGGNEYEPSTSTVVGSSPHDGGLPDWGAIGKLVFMDSMGAKYITGQGFDDLRGQYFTVDGTTVNEADEKIQSTYNKHPYNLFDFFIDMADISDSAIITVEYGYSFSQIIGRHESELVTRVEDSDQWHMVKWGDTKNRGDMVYQSFPQPFIMLEGVLKNIYPNENEISRGDSKTYSLYQSSFLGFSFVTAKASKKLCNKLNIASGTGMFEINGVSLVRSGDAIVEGMGTTNLNKWSCDFDYGGNQLGIQDDEFDILDISTGVVGGGNAAKGDDVPDLGAAPVFDGKTRYVDGSGRFVTVGGKFSSVD